MFFDQEWHPDRCGCSECHHEEQQVLRQFENEMNRLEDEVQKSNEFTSTGARHIETEWPAEGGASLGVSDHSAEPPQEAPTPRDPHLPHGASRCRGEGAGKEKEGERRDSPWTRRQGHQGRSDEADSQASDEEVGLSFAKEIYKQYEVRHVMHEQWPPAQAWAEPCGENDHRQYSNGTHHHHHHYQFGYNNYDSDDNDSDHLDSENNIINQQHHGSSPHPPAKGRTVATTDASFKAANQERYNDSVSAKKSKRKLTLRVKDTINRRYHSPRPLASVSHAELVSLASTLASVPPPLPSALPPAHPRTHALTAAGGAGDFVAEAAAASKGRHIEVLPV